MSNFFSFNTAGKKPFYFDWPVRQKILSGELKGFDPDSHASVAAYHGVDEDRCNKYEYDPLTGVFRVDQINARTDDRVNAEAWVRQLDFRTVVEPLIIKPIVHPFKVAGTRLCGRDKASLREWASVGASVWASVGAYAGAYTGSSVWASAASSVWESVRESVRAAVRAAVGAYAGAYTGSSVWASAGASVWAYASSFFDLPELRQFRCCANLWERGFVPSFDGKTWRLHHGPAAKVVYEIAAKELKGEG